MKKILLWVVGVFAIIQFIPIDRTNKPIDKKQNFVDVLQTPESIKQTLKNACYDCHSNEVKYPKYAYVAPISWSVKQHINKGRRNVNFSEWSSYNREQKEHIIDEVIETTESKEMPLKGYIPMHPEANLTDAQRKVFVDYFKELQKTGKY